MKLDHLYLNATLWGATGGTLPYGLCLFVINRAHHTFLPSD